MREYSDFLLFDGDVSVEFSHTDLYFRKVELKGEPFLPPPFLGSPNLYRWDFSLYLF